jgi:cell fate (sporulation/competence/biofilm development) regulator YlbF (YheA/YmcA/DUF963 family)
MDEKEKLIDHARELSEIIKKTETYRHFIEQREVLERDHEAGELVKRLVTLGKEISENISSGENSSQETLSELEKVKTGFESNNTAREYIDSQKKYLGLLDEVFKRIVNPEEE